MIHYFSLENFACFREKVVLDLRSQLDKDTNRIFNSHGKKLNKVTMLMGHNASGKTTVLKSISHLAWFMSNSFSLSINQEFPFSSFFFNQESSSFELGFSCKENLYDYSVCLVKNIVLKETLYLYKNKRKKLIFERKYEDMQCKIESAVGFLDYDITIKQNTSLLSLARQYKVNLAEDICTYLETWKSNVQLEGKVLDRRDWGQFVAMGQWYLDNPLFLRVANRIFSQLDQGFGGLDILTVKNPINKKVEALTYARHILRGGEEEELLLLDESYGTQSLFYLLNKIFPVLRDGGVVLLDEFDSELHAHILPLLFNLFYTNRLNPNHGQLIFSTHHHQIIANMNKEQVYLAEKSDNSESILTCISEIKEIIHGPNLLKNYYNKLFKLLNH